MYVHAFKNAEWRLMQSMTFNYGTQTTVRILDYKYAREREKVL